MLSKNSSLLTSLVSSSVGEAATILAECRIAGMELRNMRKAAGLSDWIRENPGMTATLAGAGVGAGVGGLTSMSRSGKKRRRPLDSILTGALAGSAIGSGAHLATKAVSNWRTQQSPMNVLPLPPKVQQNSPKILEEINELNRKSLPTSIVGKINDGIGHYTKNHPFLTALGLGDLGWHTLGTAGRMADPEAIGINPDNFRSAVRRSLEGEKSFLNRVAQGKETLKKGQKPNVVKIERSLSDLSARLDRMTRQEVIDMLVKARAGAPDLGVAKGFGVDDVRAILREHGNKIQPGGAASADSVVQSIKRMLGRVPKPGGKPHDPLRGTGYTLDAAGNAVPRVAKGWRNLGHKAERLLETGVHNPFGSRWLPRAGLYAGVPLALDYLSTSIRERKNQQRIRELLDQLAAG